MKKLENKKKNWVKPEVVTLRIKKDTFAGSVNGNEKNQGATYKP